MASLRKRGKVHYARYWLGEKQRIVCLHTKSYPMAKEKLRPTVHYSSPHFSGLFFLGSGPTGAIFKWEIRVESTLRPQSNM